jgi:hypothetical protein
MLGPIYVAKTESLGPMAVSWFEIDVMIDE